MAINYKDKNGVTHSLIPDMNNIDDTAASTSTTYSSSKVNLLLNNKQNVEAGKGLSSNDFTDDDKTAILNSPITTTSTGTDLTFSTSSGNINTLTVYGKSEVVDGAIVSAGEGWATVDLGTLTWTYERSVTRFYASLPSLTTTINRTGLICAKYKADVSPVWDTHIDKTICFYAGTNVYVNDYDYTDATAFKNSLNGVILAYQLADPTQGNCIAIKTDDGTGINGTMAVFSTGTPLRGITGGAKDVMSWDGSAGTVTKKCNKVRLADLTWQYYSQYNSFVTDSISDKQPVDTSDYSKGILCNKYPAYNAWWTENTKPDKTISCTANVGIAIKDTDYTTVEDFVASLGDAELVYELAIPTTASLTSTENNSIAGLRTFEPQTHAQNNAGTKMTIEAYAGTANGKAVQELENRIKSEIDEVKNEKSHFCYSYKIDMSDSNPATCVKPHFDTRYGCDNFNFTSAHMDYANDKFEYGSWEGFIRRIARPCMLKYDGTVDYYLDPDDYSKKITGEASDVADVNYQGNAMVELEKLYFKRYTYNGVQYCFISDRKLDKSFKCYAHHDKYGKELDYIYRACYDGMYDGTRLRSISGIDYHNLNALTAGYIMSNTTRQEEMNFAKANNVSTEKGEGWNILHKAEWDYINDILFLIGMSTDVQTTFGCGRDSGYVSATDTGIISTGTMDDKGLFWGKNDGSAGVKVLGIENHWANLYKSMAGYINASGTQKIKQTYGTEDGSTVVGFNTDGTGYVAIVGATPTKGDSSANGGGYITAWKYNDYGLIPYECTSAGSSAKFIPDYIYFNNNQTNFALVGGSSGVSLFCGLYVALGDAAGGRYWYFGAALSYKPLSAA